MKRKLQKRFILSGLVAILIMLFFVDMGFRTFSYNQLKGSLDQMITYIIDHNGTYGMAESETEQETEQEGQASETDGDAQTLSTTEADDGMPKVKTQSMTGDEQNVIAKLIYGIRDFGNSISGNIEFTPESRYRMRYFLVKVESDGEVGDLSLSHIATIDQDAAEELALEHYEHHKKSGILEYGDLNYYYKAVRQEDGSTTVGFLECTMETDSLQAMRRIVILVSMCVVVMFTIILAFISSRAIQPYLENVESQKQFITNAGHELKTPLAIISANTEVIEMMNGESEWTDSIKSQVRRSTGLINSMLALARMNETQKIELTQVDLSGVVNESAGSFGTVVSRQKKKLETQVQDKVTVLGDRNLLTELVNILIDNAAKYCDDGGTIRVILKKKGRSGALLQVSNDYKDGAGQDYRKFFQRFYRADTSHNSKKSGHGIGLSMAQSITEKMKGNIGASWKDGVITFTVNL